MNADLVYSEPHEINNKLAVFGVTLEDLQGVALEAANARNQASPLHPSNAPGMYSYMAGVPSLRMIFLGKEGWDITRPKNIEGVVNKRLGLMVLFQNVDRACGLTDPCPVSAKGAGIAEIVDNPTEYLFDFMREEDRQKENQHVWFFCVSSKGDQIRAELSRPRAMKNGKFGTFAERIFVIQDSDWNPTPVKNTDPIQDFEIEIKRREN